jgi:hypothetical protein
LVKFADVSPDQFICSGSEEKKFELNIYDITTTGATITDVWDFGGNATSDIKTGFSRGRGHCSYSYQLPFAVRNGAVATFFPISTTSNPAKAVMADRNPFWDAIRPDALQYAWDTTTKKITTDNTKIQLGNSTPHQKEGQNVLYADIHTKFEKTANCGIESDNIYTAWGKTAAEMAAMPADGDVGTGANATRQCGGQKIRTTPTDTTKFTIPQSDEDNLLVSDYN